MPASYDAVSAEPASMTRRGPLRWALRCSAYRPRALAPVAEEWIPGGRGRTVIIMARILLRYRKGPGATLPRHFRANLSSARSLLAAN